MSDPHNPDTASDGTIITFYSYKGGTGRTMALANVAWILAANGKRVLVADWDLESPGLHRFYHPFLKTEIVKDAPGIIDLIREFEWAAAHAKRAEGDDVRLIEDRARVQRYAFSLDWTLFPEGGSLDYLSAGRQNSDYAATLSALDWDNFYDRLGGGQFFDALRADMKRHYDYVLIDSRTGLSDVADICTVHLPDVLVDCFTLSTQGIEGAAQVARVIKDQYANRGIRILPVPMRVDQAEKERAESGLAYAVRRFSGLPTIPPEERRNYWAAVEVPYRAFYAYEEMLAVFGDTSGSPTTLLASFERLTGYITEGKVTSLPEIGEPVRRDVRRAFTRGLPTERPRIILDYDPIDQLWAEWIRLVLEEAGVEVRDRQADASVAWATEGDEPPRIMSVVSATSMIRDPLPGEQPSYAVYVTDVRPQGRWRPMASTMIFGLPESEATGQLLGLLGDSDRKAELGRTAGVRYPGEEPLILGAPARNARFTGREEDLRRLRERLQERGTAVVLPVTIHGLGGVGKTQLALEYLHRFKNDYDIVWWMNCGQPQFIDAALSDLGGLLQEHIGPVAPAGANVSETAAGVLRALGERGAINRWLLVYDNAEDIEDVQRYLPSGSGHVLITSRNRAWSADALARPLPIDVFSRAESIAHLRNRVEAVSGKEADQVAEILGDLPLAVATAGAWLAETGAPVAEYLLELQRKGPRALSVSQLADYPQRVAQTWDLSLNRLQERSPAAGRLLELCSFLASDISLHLLYNPTMAEVLAPLDPMLSEPMVIGRVIQEINRLALIKLDTNAGQLQMHRLVQAVVQDRMSTESAESARRDVLRVLAAARPRREVDDPDTWSRYRMIWPHLTPSNAMHSELEPVRHLLIDRVRYLWQRGDLERGRELATTVETAWEELLVTKADDKDFAALPRQLLHLRFNLANILRDLARFQEARNVDQAVLGGQRKLLGPEHPHTLMTAGSLAADLRALGQYAEGLGMDRQTHPAWTDLYGEDHPRTLSAAYNLAISYRITGNYARSLALDEDTLKRRRATLGSQHPRSLDSAIAVGRDLFEGGRYQEAATWMRSIRQSCEKALGTDNRATLNAKALLGMALRSAGNPRQAEPHFLAAWEGLVRRFGEDSSDALACRLSHTSNLLSLDQVYEAEAEVRKVMSVYERRLGAGHPHTLACQVNLSSALRLQNDETATRAAMAAIRTASAGLDNRLGPNHPYTLAAKVVLAVILTDDGALEDAHDLEEQTTHRLTLTLGEQHPDTLRSHANLLLTTKDLGDPDADVRRNTIIGALEKQLGTDHPNIATLRGGRRLLRGLDPQPF